MFPSALLPFPQGKRRLAGVDIGGTTVTAIVVDERWQLLADETVATDLSDNAATMASIAAGIRRALTAAGTTAPELAALGVGIPGMVDPQRGISHLAVNLRWSDYPLAQRLTELFGVPAFLENDVRVAALGVHTFDNPNHLSDLVYVALGTGMAAGVILDGQIFRGRHGLAGEFGHFTVEPNGVLCGCGNRGCLETIVSASGVIRLAREALAAGGASALRADTPFMAREVYAAAAAGDRLAHQVIERVGTELGRALRNVALAYDVDEIVLGGGITRAGDLFLAPLRAEWARQREEAALARFLLTPELVRIADPTRNMGAWGAAALAARRLNQRERG
jgi:glucokinase